MSHLLGREGYGVAQAERVYRGLVAAGYAIGPGDVRCGSEQGLCSVLAGHDEGRRAEVRAIIAAACGGERP